MTTIHITACGDYMRDMPPELVTALRESIRQHLKAYGLTNIYVLTNGAVASDGLESERDECPNCVRPPHAGPCKDTACGISLRHYHVNGAVIPAVLVEMGDAERELFIRRYNEYVPPKVGPCRGTR